MIGPREPLPFQAGARSHLSVIDAYIGNAADDEKQHGPEIIGCKDISARRVKLQ